MCVNDITLLITIYLSVAGVVWQLQLYYDSVLTRERERERARARERERERMS